ncbi:putative regulator of chromosome condensation 1/beta-lactamase-inhibitor protein II [Helianthus anomalus]
MAILVHNSLKLYESKKTSVCISLLYISDHFGSGEHGDQVYGFGSGKCGQLGISKEKVKSVSLPQSVSGLQEVDVSSISANGDHSAALSSDAHLYAWGRGFGGTPDMCCPNRVISCYSFKQVALGWNHVLLLTDEGYILMLGEGGSHHGVLSNPQKEISVNRMPSKEIPGLDRIKVAGVASGSEHSVITTGKHFGWHNGRFLQVG